MSVLPGIPMVSERVSMVAAPRPSDFSTTVPTEAEAQAPASSAMARLSGRRGRKTGLSCFRWHGRFRANQR